MGLRKEYKAIANKFADSYLSTGLSLRDAMDKAALACQELADRPPRELTLKEIDDLWPANYQRTLGDYSAPRRFIAAIHAKQREPETVKFRAARLKGGQRIGMLPVAGGINCQWEWLEPAQEFEVKLP